MKLEFKCYFQEIWDYVLSYEDWGAQNLDYFFAKQDGKGLNAGIKFHVTGQDGLDIRNEITKPDIANPEWSTFTNEVKYRGTMNDLENQVLHIEIKSTDGLFLKPTEEYRTSTDMKGVTVDGMFKLNVLPENENQQRVKENFKDFKGDIPESVICGKINANGLPRFRQSGTDTVIFPDEVYLCIFVKKLVISTLPSYVKQTLKVFLTVEWNGKTYETTKLPFQNTLKLNQELYFLFGVDKSIINESMEKRTDEIKKNLKTVKNEVVINLWAEDIFGCRDFIGQIILELIDIFEAGKNVEKRYQIDSTTEEVYFTRVFSGKQSFSSALLKENISLDYEYWFYPEKFPKGITDLNRTHIKKQEHVNPVLEQVKKCVINAKDEVNKLKEKLKLEDDKVTRFFDFKIIKGEEESQENMIEMFYVYDQNNKERLLNSFLSKLTIKGFQRHPSCKEFDILTLLKE